MKIQLDIKSCKECPFWKEGPSETTDGFDRGNDWICTKNKNKIIAGFVEWHEVNKTPVPEWCPIKVEYTCNADCPDVEFGSCCHPDNCQKKDKLIAKQSIKIQEYEEIIRDNVKVVDEIKRKFYSIGAPLNDNFLKFNKEQMFWCFKVADLLEGLRDIDNS